MPDTKISEDPAVTSLSGAEKAPCVQSGANKTFTPAQINTYIRAAGLTAELAALVSAAELNAATSQMADNTKAANFTFALSDGATPKITRSNSAGSVTGTIPLNSTVAFPVGQILNLVRYGEGSFNIAAAAGVTLRVAADRAPSVRAQYAGATLWKVGTDTWLLMGELT